jgi:hypothetical protein
VLALVKDLNKKIKICIKHESTRIFQAKAISPDPKIFWQAVNESLGKSKPCAIELKINNSLQTDPLLLAETFADFFLEKVKDLSVEPSYKIPLIAPICPIVFTFQEVSDVVSKVKGKKCFGLDGVPQVILKDAVEVATHEITHLFNKFASKGLPETLKEAQILPLHKKGEKDNVKNYRPISNLSPFSKFYERCILARLEAETSD